LDCSHWAGDCVEDDKNCITLPSHMHQYCLFDLHHSILYGQHISVATETTPI